MRHPHIFLTRGVEFELSLLPMLDMKAENLALKKHGDRSSALACLIQLAKATKQHILRKH